MSRPYTAWWNRTTYNSPESVAQQLRRFRRAIEGRVTWYERQFPGDVDWEPLVWDAAYRAAFMCYPGAFWKVFKKTVWWLTAPYVARHRRRADKLVRLQMDEIDEPLW